jgi:transcriptional regulator with XRE-family HTH domain
MKRFISSEKLLIEEVTQSAEKTRKISRGLPIGSLIKMIRTQLGMSQKNVAKRARVPQSTIARIEKGEKDANLSTLNRILEALFCDLVTVPVLRESIETIRRKQARKLAEIHIRYLKGTMSLEAQQPDSRLLEEILKQEEDRLLQGKGSELWEK